MIETTEFDVYVTEKQAPVKDGIHLFVPSVITRPALQLLLRKDVLGPLAEVFEPLELANAVEDVVDEAQRYRYTVRDSNEAYEGSHSDMVLVGVGEERPTPNMSSFYQSGTSFDELTILYDLSASPSA